MVIFPTLVSGRYNNLASDKNNKDDYRWETDGDIINVLLIEWLILILMVLTKRGNDNFDNLVYLCIYGCIVCIYLYV